jgi:hypothetical protein
MGSQDEWARAAAIANRAASALDRARFELGALAPGDDGVSYERHLTVARREIDRALELADVAASAYARSDELYEVEQG